MLTTDARHERGSVKGGGGGGDMETPACFISLPQSTLFPVGDSETAEEESAPSPSRNAPLLRFLKSFYTNKAHKQTTLSVGFTYYPQQVSDTV